MCFCVVFLCSCSYWGKICSPITHLQLSNRLFSSPILFESAVFVLVSLCKSQGHGDIFIRLNIVSLIVLIASIEPSAMSDPSAKFVRKRALIDCSEHPANLVPTDKFGMHLFSLINQSLEMIKILCFRNISHEPFELILNYYIK